MASSFEIAFAFPCFSMFVLRIHILSVANLLLFFLFSISVQDEHFARGGDGGDGGCNYASAEWRHQ
jgi:hypothetical protein